MKQSISRLRAIFLIALLIVISLLLVRFVLEFSESTQRSVIGGILLIPTEFITIFFRHITIGAIEVSTIIAIIFFIILGYISSKILTAIERDDEDSTLFEIIEAILRSVEFLIILRVILKFIGADGANSAFTGLIYLLTDWSGVLLQPLNLSFGLLDISALLSLLLVIVLDVNTEVILRAVKLIKNGSSKSVDFISNSTLKKAVEDRGIETETKEENSITPLPPSEEASEPSAEESKTPEGSAGEKTIVIQLPQPGDSESQQSQVIQIKGDEIEVKPAEPIQPQTKHKDDITAPEG